MSHWLPVSRLTLNNFKILWKDWGISNYNVLFIPNFRCEWCGITAHATCHKLMSPECNFGIFEAIFLPPHAVSIPRTEVPMETMIGVSSKNLKSKDALAREFVCRKSSSFFPTVHNYNCMLDFGCYTSFNVLKVPPHSLPFLLSLELTLLMTQLIRCFFICLFYVSFAL